MGVRGSAVYRINLPCHIPVLLVLCVSAGSPSRGRLSIVSIYPVTSLSCLSLYQFTLSHPCPACLMRLRGFTFTWSGCCSLCLCHNQPSLPTPFYSALVSISAFKALLTVFHSINSPDNSPLSHSLFRSYFCRTGPFNYISLHQHLFQP